MCQAMGLKTLHEIVSQQGLLLWRRNYYPHCADKETDAQLRNVRKTIKLGRGRAKMWTWGCLGQENLFCSFPRLWISTFTFKERAQEDSSVEKYCPKSNDQQGNPDHYRALCVSGIRALKAGKPIDYNLWLLIKRVDSGKKTHLLSHS